MREPASRSPFSLAVISAHLLVVACAGQHYSKLKLPIDGLPLYPTEIVLGLAVLGSMSAFSRLRWDLLSKLVALFVAVGLVWIAIGGMGPSDGAGAKAFSFFVYSGFYFVMRAAAPSDAALWRLLRLFAVAAVIAALIGLWQMQSGEPLFGSEDFEITTTGSTRWLPGEFTLYAMVGALVVAVSMIIERRVTATQIVLLAAAAFELVLAQHRSGFVAFAVALLATAGFLGGSTQALKGLLKLVIVVTIGLVVFITLFGGEYIDDTINRIAHTSDFSDANIDWRLLSWYEVFDGVVDRPFGHGFATWDFLFTWSNPLTGSHNSYLDLAYRIGIEGLVAFAALPVVLIRDVRRLVQATSARAQLLGVTVCAALIAFLIFAAFNVVFETPHMSVLFWVLLGIGGVVLERQRASSGSKSSLGTPIDDASAASVSIAVRHEAGDAGPSSVTT